ncbi:hypothetical protein [Bacillus sp. JJ1764]|uniref:hypothetical protein n=1 Tax=Bacillus sp. JJ1764 TaxID=3122964 RepID=UPI002FFF70DA
MSGRMTDKEKLLAMLNGINNQLECLELALEASFSEQRVRMKREEQIKVANVVTKLTNMEAKWNNIQVTEGRVLSPQSANTLKLKMGY